jgi:thioredoxin reductase (NADPH)
MSEPSSPTLEARRAQTFPTLGADEIARLHRFGKPRRFSDGAHVLETGKVSPGIYLVLKGAIRVTGREGRGVWYWASPIEAKMCAGQEVVLVGGGNSAGQAAVFLAGYAAKVWMLVRGPGLAASMSKYLIDRITGTPNIELVMRTEITSLSGARELGVESVTWRNGSGRKETRPIRHVFLFLGADPSTDWLKDCDVAVDDKGFVTTGGDARLPLQTSVPGVFAIGDVRAGSVKRVGAAIGEGAAVVAQIHAYLATMNTRIRAAEKAKQA